MVGRPRQAVWWHGFSGGVDGGAGRGLAIVVSVLDLAIATTAATVAVGTNPASVAVSPCGRRAYVTNYESDDVSVIESTSVIATIPVGHRPNGVRLCAGGAVELAWRRRLPDCSRRR